VQEAGSQLEVQRSVRDELLPVDFIDTWNFGLRPPPGPGLLAYQ